MAQGPAAEALRMALRFETENFEEYDRDAREATDPGVRAMFEFLAGEERRHMELIRDMMRRHDVQP